MSKQLDQSKKIQLLNRIENTRAQAQSDYEKYLSSIHIKRNRTSLVLTSFMHNVVDIENAVSSNEEILKPS